jgi:hypothetical protein
MVRGIVFKLSGILLMGAVFTLTTFRLLEAKEVEGSDIGKETRVDASDTQSLKVFGSKGLQVQGICLSPDRAYQKKFSGVTPAEVNFDYRVDRCEITSQKKGRFNVNFFHNRRLMYERNEVESTAGIEFKIPFN